MTDKDTDSGSHERRSVLKALGIGGLAATGLSASAGTAAAQTNGNKKAVAEITDVQNTEQTGTQGAAGLVVVQLQNVNVSDVLDVAVAVGDDVVDIDEINILNNNTVQIVLTDTIDVNVGQVAVTVLGQTVQDALFAVGDTTNDVSL